MESTSSAPDLEMILLLYSLRLKLVSLETNRDTDETDVSLLTSLKQEISKLASHQRHNDEWLKPDSAPLRSRCEEYKPLVKREPQSERFKFKTGADLYKHG